MKISARLGFASASALGLLLALPGCDLVLGLNNYQDCTSNCGGANATGSTSASTASGTGGAAPQCTAANAVANCDDMNPCTDDTCAMGACQHMPSAELTACGTGKAGACDGTGACLVGTASWANSWGGGTAKHQGRAIVVDKAGNIFVAGGTDGPISFGGAMLTPATPTQGFLLKLGPTGTPLASTLVDATSNATAVASDGGGNLFVTGQAGPGGKSLVKFDATGAALWGKSFGAVNAFCAAATPTGDVFIAGSFAGTANFGGVDRLSSNGPAFIAKFDGMGVHLWDKQFTSTNAVTPNACAVDKNGQFVVVGDAAASTDFGGGAVAYPGMSSSAMFVAKFDGSGSHLWSHLYGAAGWQHATAVTTDSSTNILFAGAFFGSFTVGPVQVVSAGSGDQAFVVKLNPTGQHLWNQEFGNGVGDADASGVTVDGADRVVLVGTHKGSFDLGGGITSMTPGGFMLKLSSTTGKRYWAKNFDLGGATAVAVDAQGSELTTGVIGGQVDFGGVIVPPKGDLDVFVASFAP